MDALSRAGIDQGARSGAAAENGTCALGWARIYHFLELAFAHPGEDGFAYFCAEPTWATVVSALNGLPDRGGVAVRAGLGLAKFRDGLRQRSFEQAEADHIALFSANFPLVPCPPYGSLFLVDENKRLEEMLAIKNFYHACGVETASSFDDLPDHVCVELEFMQLLCFRERDANVDRDSLAVTETRRSQAEFLDRFLLPFAKRLAELAARTMPDNPYTPLLDAAQLLIALHRSELSEHAPMSLPRESLS